MVYSKGEQKSSLLPSIYFSLFIMVQKESIAVGSFCLEKKINQVDLVNALIDGKERGVVQQGAVDADGFRKLSCL